MNEKKSGDSLMTGDAYAWQRIGDLAAAIRRQYSSVEGDPAQVEKWAEEIVIQTRLVRKFKGKEVTL